MEKVKIITAEQLLSADTKPSHKTLMWHGHAVTVRYLIPLIEVTQFINSVMNSCYDKEHDLFMPDMMDFAFRVNVVSRYASVELPGDINKQYSVLYNTDIFDVIVSNVNSSQIKSIRDSIDICMMR